MLDIGPRERYISRKAPRANHVRPYKHCPIVFPLKKNFKFPFANFL